tara:strand:+ start:1829 stop:2104 length:276 start_codon:yes stop_codon:yes gene_type:complete
LYNKGYKVKVLGLLTMTLEVVTTECEYDDFNEVEQYRVHLSEAELLDLHDKSPYRLIRVKAGLALGYGGARLKADEIIHYFKHPSELRTHQ